MQQLQATLKEVHFDKSTHGLTCGRSLYTLYILYTVQKQRQRNTELTPRVFTYSKFGPAGEQRWLVSGPGKRRHHMTYLNDGSSKARQSTHCPEGKARKWVKEEIFLYLVGPILNINQFQWLPGTSILTKKREDLQNCNWIIVGTWHALSNGLGYRLQVAPLLVYKSGCK